MSTKVAVWAVWCINTLIGIVYCAVAIVSFKNVKQGAGRLVGGENLDAFKGALLASTMMGFLMVLAFILLSAFVLMRATMKDVADATLGYGLMLGTCLHTGFFLLLAGLVLNSAESTASRFKDAGIWKQRDYTTYVATYGFSFILCGTQAILFLVLLLCRTSLKEKSTTKYEVTSAPQVTQVPSTAYNGNVQFGSNV